MTWQDSSIIYKGRELATKDANGVDLMYPGPNGTAFYRGEPIGDRCYEIPALIQRRRDGVEPSTRAVEPPLTPSEGNSQGTRTPARRVGV